MKYSKEYLSKLASESVSMADFLRKLGKTVSPGNYPTYWKKFEKYDIDVSHWHGNQVSIKALKSNHKKRKRTLEEILVENSDYTNSSRLKKRLIKEGLLINHCYNENCPTREIPLWRGKEIKFELDHINGKNRDHRIENLRLLCPICHSQTPTYCSKNIKTKATLNLCKDCNKKISDGATYCRICVKSHVKSRKKFDYPPMEELLREIKRTSQTAVAKKIGCAVSTLRKHLRVNGTSQNCTEVTGSSVQRFTD